MTHTTLSIKMRYIIKKRNCLHEKNNKCCIFSLVLVIKLRGHVTEIFLLSKAAEDRQESEILI